MRYIGNLLGGAIGGWFAGAMSGAVYGLLASHLFEAITGERGSAQVLIIPGFIGGAIGGTVGGVTMYGAISRRYVEYVAGAVAGLLGGAIGGGALYFVSEADWRPFTTLSIGFVFGALVGAFNRVLPQSAMYKLVGGGIGGVLGAVSLYAIHSVMEGAFYVPPFGFLFFYYLAIIGAVSGVIVGPVFIGFVRLFEGKFDRAFVLGFAGTLFLTISGTFVGVLMGQSIDAFYLAIVLAMGGAFVGTVIGILIKKLVGRTSKQRDRIISQI